MCRVFERAGFQMSVLFKIDHLNTRLVWYWDPHCILDENNSSSIFYNGCFLKAGESCSATSTKLHHQASLLSILTIDMTFNEINATFAHLGKNFKINKFKIVT
jgi:hypothetical protein